MCVSNLLHSLASPNSICDLLQLPFHVQWQDLKDLFRQAGTIVRADVALGPDGRSRGFGTVVFATEKDARRAVGMFSGYVRFSLLRRPCFYSPPSPSSLFLSIAIAGINYALLFLCHPPRHPTLVPFRDGAELRTRGQ